MDTVKVKKKPGRQPDPSSDNNKLSNYLEVSVPIYLNKKKPMSIKEYNEKSKEEFKEKEQTMLQSLQEHIKNTPIEKLQADWKTIEKKLPKNINTVYVVDLLDFWKSHYDVEQRALINNNLDINKILDIEVLRPILVDFWNQEITRMPTIYNFEDSLDPGKMVTDAYKYFNIHNKMLLHKVIKCAYGFKSAQV